MYKYPKHLQDMLDSVGEDVEALLFHILHPIKHLIPMDDYKHHKLSADCDCKPDLDEDVCIHNYFVPLQSRSIN